MEPAMNAKKDNISQMRPSMNDAQIVFELMIAYDIAEFGAPDSDLEDLKDSWSKIDLNQDAWLAVNPAGQLVAYAAVFRDDLRFNYDLYTHPTLAPAGLSEHLLVMCEKRAQAQVGDTEGDATATIIVSPANKKEVLVAERLGYKPDRYHFGMRMTFEDSPASPKWPEGVTLRNVVPGQDDRLVYDFIQIAFDRPGRVPPSYAHWHDTMMGATNFNPDLWLLAYHAGELIGANLCFEYPECGWVRQLGVLKTWRGKGIGSSLLRHIFGVFHARGHTMVELVVAADNPNACHLYESVGMERKRYFAEYRKRLATLTCS
jgi:mycothiol synthase